MILLSAGEMIGQLATLSKSKAADGNEVPGASELVGTEFVTFFSFSRKLSGSSTQLVNWLTMKIESTAAAL